MLRKEPREKRYEGYQFGDDIVLLCNTQLYMPNSVDLKHLIMEEFHRRPYVWMSSIGDHMYVTLVIKKW
jgi:hypothetical protein